MSLFVREENMIYFMCNITSVWLKYGEEFMKVSYKIWT